jgi:N-methylhydantoinase B
VAERRLKELCAKYGKEIIKTFIRDWLDYSEQRMIHGIRKMPKAKMVNTGRHDPFEPLLPDGIPLKVEIEIDPQNAAITIDLRDNIDNIDCGFNEASLAPSAVAWRIQFARSEIPRNSGSFRRVKMLMRRAPWSEPSSHIAARSPPPASTGWSIAPVPLAQLGDGYGLAEGRRQHGRGRRGLRQGSSPTTAPTHQLIIANGPPSGRRLA